MPDIFWWLAFVLVLIFGGTALIGAPYVPSRRRDIKTAFDELYRLGEKDILVDIGSGDGVVLRQAAQRGARAVGYEINPILVLISRFLCRRQPAVSVRLTNFWTSQLPPGATVVYLFGDGRDIKRMESWLQNQANKLARPLNVISYGFTLPAHTPINQLGAHHLYQLVPLHPEEA